MSKCYLSESMRKKKKNYIKRQDKENSKKASKDNRLSW